MAASSIHCACVASYNVGIYFVHSSITDLYFEYMMNFIVKGFYTLIYFCSLIHFCMPWLMLSLDSQGSVC